MALTNNLFGNSLEIVHDAADANVVTHDGIFHGDDIMSIAILSVMMATMRILRTSDPKKIAEAAERGAYIIDVGGVYDPASRQFDHHQRGFSEAREDGTRYSSAGLLWKELGELNCKSFGCLKWKRAEAAEIVDRILIRGIDAADNGQKLPGGGWSLYDFLGANNATRREVSIPGCLLADCLTEDAMFLETCDVARHILWRAVEKALSIVFGQHEVEKAVQAAVKGGSQIIEMDGFIDEWRETTIKTKEDILFGMYEDHLRHQWVVQAIPPSLDAMDAQRKPLPEAWRGLSGAALAKATGVQDAVFCHVAGFMCTAKTREGALALAKLAVEA